MLPAYCANASHPCDVEDTFLHYQVDPPTFNSAYGLASFCSRFGGCALFKGYPPGPSATGTSVNESRVPDAWNISWRLSNLSSSSVFNYSLAKALNSITLGGYVADYFGADIALFDARTRTDLFNTSQYFQVPTTLAHPRTPELAQTIAALSANASLQVNRSIRHAPNAVLPYYFRIVPFYSYILQYWNGIYFEVAYEFESRDPPSGASGRPHYFEVDFEPALNLSATSETTGLQVFYGTREWLGPSSDRGKTFLLSVYYVLAAPSWFFNYLDETWLFNSNGVALSNPTTALNFTQRTWFDAESYDVGAPTVNPLGKTDFLGQNGTSRAYLLDSGVDPSAKGPGNSNLTFRIYARNYQNAWVIAKIMPQYGTMADNSSFNISLNASYKPLYANGSFGPALSTLSIRNNEAFILVPCTESWSCSSWSACSSSSQTRTCTDDNACGTSISKPAETQSCSSSGGSGGSGGGGGGSSGGSGGGSSGSGGGSVATPSPTARATPVPTELPTPTIAFVSLPGLDLAAEEIERAKASGEDVRELEIGLQAARDLESQGQTQRALSLVQTIRLRAQALLLRSKSADGSRDSIYLVSGLVVVVLVAVSLYASSSLRKRPPVQPVSPSPPLPAFVAPSSILPLVSPSDNALPNAPNSPPLEKGTDAPLAVVKK